MDEKRGEKRRRRRRAKTAYGDVDVKAPNIAGRRADDPGLRTTNMNKIFQKERGREREERSTSVFVVAKRGRRPAKHFVEGKHSLARIRCAASMYNPTKGERSLEGEERREGRGNICIIRQVNVYSDRERASMQSLCGASPTPAPLGGRQSNNRRDPVNPG